MRGEAERSSSSDGLLLVDHGLSEICAGPDGAVGGSAWSRLRYFDGAHTAIRELSITNETRQTTFIDGCSAMDLQLVASNADQRLLMEVVCSEGQRLLTCPQIFLALDQVGTFGLAKGL